MQEGDLARLLQAGMQEQQQGAFDAARSFYGQVLAADPDNPDALHLIGLTHYQQGRQELAAEFIGRAITARPGIADFYQNYGLILRELGRIPEAISNLRQALRLNPNHIQAYNSLGLALRDNGDLKGAIDAYRHALRLRPDHAASLNNLGVAFFDRGNLDEAIEAYEKALGYNPGYAEAQNNLGYALQVSGRPERALLCFREAIRLKPQFAEAHANLGNTLQTLRQLEQATAAYRVALRFRPDYVRARINLGSALREQGRSQEAVEQYEQAVRIDPKSFTARFGACIAQIPVIYRSDEEMRISRNRYAEKLTELHGALQLDSAEGIIAASEAVGSVQPFYLPFQGRNDRELQSMYGALVSRIQAARYPSCSRPPRIPPPKSAERIRIGIVSAFFYQHSNWKMPVGGWVRNLDRSRFLLHGYYTGTKGDSVTDQARTLFHHFHESPLSFEMLLQKIRKDRLHVLIYPEVGMDPTTLKLAALRLAPVQCTSWGHPNTSGLPSMDYYLSSDLMEPEDGQEHYTERLIRLPNVSFWCDPPHDENRTLGRSEFGMREDSVAYLCSHSPLTYLPQFDPLFPKIARQVGNSQFIFVGFHKSDEVTRILQTRLEKAFSDFGLRSSDHLVFLPHQTQARYTALNRICDAFLDSIGWSACNSTLEAIACNLPVVTLPGSLMRSRHSYAMLAMMGMTETVAKAEDDYIRIAVRLGTEPEWRGKISESVSRCKPRLYRDPECIRGLESFLEKTARGV